VEECRRRLVKDLIRRWLSIVLALMFVAPLAATSVHPVQAQSAGRTFTETGKMVKGKFLHYWLLNGGLPQQGFPISEEMEEVSETDGKAYSVQYFERAVFEYHPENPPPNDVLLSLLGNFLYQQKYASGVPGQQPNNTAGSVVFPETGKRVGGRFLEYWRGNGGLPQQGLPISEEFQEVSALDGKTYRVQYFERAVFEWHPEHPRPTDVLLSQLGTFRYKARYTDASVQPRPATQPVPDAAWTAAQVVRVVDGDTIEVMVNGVRQTVRYILVNTPETVDPRRPVECYGREASNANKAMVEGKTVYLEKDVSETDRFGRLLRYVYTIEGSVQAELIKGGFAQVSTFPPDVKYEPLLRSLEQDARTARRGLWGSCQGNQNGTQPPPATTPTRAPAPPAPPPPSGMKVIIASVFYDGQEPRTEGDEYAVIRNTGSSAVNMQGYTLNAGDAGQDFIFPSFVLQPGADVRVYTNRNVPGAFSFGSGRAICNNDGDCGYLYDSGSAEVSKYCY